VTLECWPGGQVARKEHERHLQADPFTASSGPDKHPFLVSASGFPTRKKNHNNNGQQQELDSTDFFFLLFLPSPVGNLLKNCFKTSNRLLPAGQQFVLSEKMSIERDRNTANHAHIISLMNDTPRVETDIFPSFIPRSNLVKLLFSLVRSVTVVKTTGPKLPDNWRWCPTRAVCVPVCGTSPPLSSLFHGSAYVLAHIAGPAAPPAPLSLLRFLAETTYFYK